MSTAFLLTILANVILLPEGKTNDNVCSRKSVEGTEKNKLVVEYIKNCILSEKNC
jgi:hypothetical protein